MLAQNIHLLTQQEVVQLIRGTVVCLGGGESGVRLVFTHFLQHFLKLIVTDAFLRVDAFGDFQSRVHVRNKVVGGCEFENVDVEGRHLRLDVVEQVCLLHVASLNANRDLLKELGNRQLFRIDFLLHKLQLNLATTVRQSRNRLFTESVSFQRVEAVVRFGRIVNNKN